jgi:glyoxylase-like metal-dependent hydrolase (beta-lactamase superfamily II)
MKIFELHTGFFKLDGGPMFGVVPRKMWAKLNPPDENNMCTWAMRALLVEIGDRKIVIDAGIGNKQDAKFRAHFEPHGAENLTSSLLNAGFKPEDITDVFLTHLHFDHCGGALTKDETTGEIKPFFPNATYWSNKKHFDWAMKPNAREKASFLQENFLPLYEMGILKFIEIKQNIEFAPGFHVRFANGHTEAMMVPYLQISKDKTLVYCADTIPTHWHIGMPFIIAYDVRPLVSLKEKEKLLNEAVKKGQVLFFEHDPATACATVKMDANERIVADKVGGLETFFSIPQ